VFIADLPSFDFPTFTEIADFCIPMLEHPTAEIGLLVLGAIHRRSVFPASDSLVEFLQTVRAGVVSRTQFLPSLLTPAIIALLKLKPCDQAGPIRLRISVGSDEGITAGWLGAR
jgi:hypothetical protein